MMQNTLLLLNYFFSCKLCAKWSSKMDLQKEKKQIVFPKKLEPITSHF